MNKFSKILAFLFIIVLVCSQVFALGDGDWDKPLDNPSPGIGKVNDTVMDVWATIRGVIQVLAVMATVFAGLRYMFASADAKADIKKSMGILAVGAMLVFASTFILDFIARVMNEALS